MNTKTVEERVKFVISEQLGVDVAGIKPTDHIVNDYIADSLDEVELVMALEDEFETEVSDAEADANQTVQQIIDFFTNNPKASK
jgi:acyl carrier protein